LRSQHPALHPSATLGLIVAGATAVAAGAPGVAATIWLAGLVVTGMPVIAQTVRAAMQGRFATDIVAMLAIVTAVILREPLAGLVIVLMQTGGEALEQYAQGRASAAVRELEAAAPRIAHRVVGFRVDDVPVAGVAVGDVVLVRPGELVPTDGVVIDGSSDLDTSQLTGEVTPLVAAPGVNVLSGMANLSGMFHMRTTALAAQSQYARIVELVRTAQASKAPLQRLADRWAVWFTPFTLVVGVATFAVTHDWTRVLAVLVVATPCPLILAVPVAIIGGVNRQARRRVIVRHGGALERLSEVTTAVFDKTGTLTVGRPRVARIAPRGAYDADVLLARIAAVERGSGHLLARVLTEYAERELGVTRIPRATDHHEVAGRGVVATVDGHDVFVGSRSYVLAHGRLSAEQLTGIDADDGGLRSYVAIDGVLAGVIEYADELRPRIADVLRRLHAVGVNKLVLLSGDHTPAVKAVAAKLGIDDARGDLLPQDKSAAVTQLRHAGEVVAMIGDGTNDAPALSAADVGIALAAHGGGITAEAADVIVLADDLERVPEAIEISKRTMRIARQSVGVGIGLSAVAMMFAAYGLIAPTVGALLQEAIDVAVIVNALRAARS
jgi:heavy metal translocating P-type ATPase